MYSKDSFIGYQFANKKNKTLENTIFCENLRNKKNDKVKMRIKYHFI